MVASLTVGILACSDAPTDPGVDLPLVTLPLVVHVVHNGEAVGSGTNLSDARIGAQIRILNEDYRRRPGTPGFNSHPDGADSRIEFALATVDPAGTPTSGINRVDASALDNPVPPDEGADFYAWYGYWDPERYVNVWVMPRPESEQDVVIGFATGPESDLPGLDFEWDPDRPEGIFINAAHFGPSTLDSRFNRGRTLTHEMGHYLGLLHPWGDGVCEENDFVADTPPAARPILGCPPQIGCAGEPTQPENFMTFTPDSCRNLFTRGQVERMRYVLQNSPRRNGLPTSPALGGGGA